MSHRGHCALQHQLLQPVPRSHRAPDHTPHVARAPLPGNTVATTTLLHPGEPLFLRYHHPRPEQTSHRNSLPASVGTKASRANPTAGAFAGPSHHHATLPFLPTRIHRRAYNTAMPEILQHVCGNGLHLLAEPMEGSKSLAMTMLLPAGVAHESADKLGAAALLSEMMFRGAGKFDARAHSDALDRLGVQRHSAVQTEHINFGATLLGNKRQEALPLLADMVTRPRLAEDSLEPARDLALQSIDALEDEPQDRVFDDLRRQHLPDPLGRSHLGQRSHLEQLSLNDIRRFQQNHFVPGRSILAFAGNFTWTELVEQVETVFDRWSGDAVEPTEGAAAPRGMFHRESDSTQLHIGIAYDTVAEPDEASVLQRAVQAVLSGGMSGRLFTEVREKRGLCYAVHASYVGMRDRGFVLGYAGTTAARAQETLDVMTAELRRISEGIEANEFDRAIVGMKSRLVMQGESTSARAGAIARDQHLLGRPRTLDEQTARVAGVTLEAVRRFAAEHPAGPMTVVTIGPEALKPS